MKYNRYYKTEFQTICPEDDCDGIVRGTGLADSESDGEIVKFIYQECIKCDWNQES